MMPSGLKAFLGGLCAQFRQILPNSGHGIGEVLPGQHMPTFDVLPVHDVGPAAAVSPYMPDGLVQFRNERLQRIQALQNRSHSLVFKLARHACLVTFLAGCATSKSSESQLQLSGKEETRSETREIAIQRVQTGPETITTTVREYGPAGGVARAYGVAPAVPTTGQLLRETVTVDQRGPSTSETSLNERAATERSAGVEVKAEAHSSSKTSWWPPAWLLLLLAGLGVGVLGFLRRAPLLLLGKQLLARILS